MRSKRIRRQASLGWLALALAPLLLAGPAAGAPGASAQEPPPTEPADEAPAAEPAAPPSAEAAPGEPGEPAAAPPTVFERIEVRGRGDDGLGAASAGEGATGAADLARRPLLRVGEVVETVPGLIATQHSGGGKANQYFLRGFNLDHGSDLRLTVGGVPVNLPTHGHGQGYADLSFVIPELVERVGFRKGPYAAADGDFATAGAVSIEIASRLSGALVEATAGSHGYGRLLAADSLPAAGGELLVAGEALTDDGPWRRGDDHRRGNLLARWSAGDAARGASLTAMASDGEWRASDQVPRRAVEAGAIDRFGLVDPDLGGDSRRASLAFEVHRGNAEALSSVRAWVLRSELDLFSNFTYFLDDPLAGDEIEQVDRRWAAGGEVERRAVGRWRGRSIETGAGFQLRADAIGNGLYRSAGRRRLATTREDDVLQLIYGPWVEATVPWTGWLRTVAGLRADAFHAEVDGFDGASASTTDLLLSPRLSFVLGPWRRSELYVNLGHGFHSNDARGATLRRDPAGGLAAAAAEPLVRTRSADLGVRTAVVPGLVTTVSLFALDLDSEIVFVGDAGTTEAGRASRRLGVEWTNFWRFGRGWVADLDVAWTRARFRDDDVAGDRIPGAVETVVAAGLARQPEDGGLDGSLRLRYLSGAPLVEDGSVESGATALVDARLGWRFPSGLAVAVEGFNLLDREDADIAYFYASRLPGEPAEGVEDVHFHPVGPASGRVVLSWRF